MNIFVVDKCPETAARMLCDEHIQKMYIESAIMLSLAHRYWDGHDEYRFDERRNRRVRYRVHKDPGLDRILYAPRFGYGHHVCSVWTRQTTGNYNWHYRHFCALLAEYRFRFGKPAATERLKQILHRCPVANGDDRLTRPALAISEKAHRATVVESYRTFYVLDKPFATWRRGRDRPDWYLRMCDNV